MNAQLLEGKCEACNIDATSLSEDEIKSLQPQIPSWSIIEDEDKIKRLICAFAFKDYEESLRFTNNVANLAEEEDHHPEIILDYGKVTVSLISHDVQKITERDIELATQIDKIYGS